MRQPRRMHEAADVDETAVDAADAEVAATERMQLDHVRRFAAVVALETEVPVRPVANERAPELRVEAAPASPRAGDDLRADRIWIGDDLVRIERRRGCGDRG